MRVGVVKKMRACARHGGVARPALKEKPMRTRTGTGTGTGTGSPGSVSVPAYHIGECRRNREDVLVSCRPAGRPAPSPTSSSISIIYPSIRRQRRLGCTIRRQVRSGGGGSDNVADPDAFGSNINESGSANVDPMKRKKRKNLLMRILPSNIFFKLITFVYYSVTLGQMKDMFLNEDYLIDAIPGLYDFFMPEESIFDIMPRFLEMSFWIQIMYYFVGFMSFVQNRRVPHVYRFHVLQAMVLDIFWLVMSGFISLTEIAPLDYFSGSLTGIRPFVMFISMFIYFGSFGLCIVGGLLGAYVDLPMVSTGVYMQLGGEN